MDKEILRIVIIVTGIVVVVAMLAWAYIKDKKAVSSFSAAINQEEIMNFINDRK